MKSKVIICLITVVMLASVMFFALSASAAQPIRLPIIMYHSVVEDKKLVGDYVIHVEDFKNDMMSLKSAGYSSVTIEDLIKYTNGEKTLPDKPIMITFDDGFLNNISLCEPILRDVNYRAVLSVVGTYTDNEERCDWTRNNDYSYLKWMEIKEASKRGVIEIQNHSYNMHGGTGRNGAKRNNNEDTACFKLAVHDDILHMQQLLEEKSQVFASCFTYPFGYFDELTKDVIKDCGFKASMICYEHFNEITPNQDCLYNLGRFNRPGNISTKHFFKKCGIEL